MTRRLLLVEEDVVDRDSIRRALEVADIGLVIDEAESLAHARQALTAETYDCVLSDLALPDGEGLELIPLANSTAFVLLTGSADTRAKAALDRGAQDYLVKDRLDPFWLGRSIEHAIERKRLQLFRSEAEHSDRLTSLGQLAASVAHEINNPTAFIAANLETVQGWLRECDQAGRGIPDHRIREIRDALSDCTTGLDRVARIVHQLRSFARGPAHVEPVSLVDIAEVADWASALTRTQITHLARFDRSVVPNIARFLGRPGRLSQVVTNLLINAAQAIERVKQDPAIVRLTVYTEPDTAVVEVEDSGPGMSPDLRPRAFEPFFTTKPVGYGTGLGLSVSAEIVHEHQGTLTLADSSLGGLKAIVRIPLATGLEASADPRTKGSELPEAQLTILVIDDEPALRRAYCRLLRPHIVHAMDAVSALQWIQDGTNAVEVDAVLCDVMMPDINGQALYEAFRDAFPRLAKRFVFCSGGVFQEELTRFLGSMPHAPVLHKPVSRDAILSAVSQVILDAPEGPSAGSYPPAD